jgi:predicted MFS family arabinose efflux permease
MAVTTLGEEERAASTTLLFVGGASAAMFASNLYYAQPLLTTIAGELGLEPRFAGSVVSASQLGYALGLFLLVPLSDKIENRRLVLICVALTLVGLVGVASARSASAFLFFALMIGIFSSGAQVLLPYLSHMLPDARRGRILGNIVAGVLTSIMLARPFALFVSAAWGWRCVYLSSAIVTAFLGAALWWTMAPRRPHDRMSYRRTIASMFVLFASETQVRRRTLYQSVLFGCFTMFWAAMPILLAERFGLGVQQIGLFALVGAGGVLAAPLAGHIADRGGVRFGTMLGSASVAAAFICSAVSVYWMLPIALAMTSFVIDGSIQISQVLSRIVVLDVSPGVRGRVNALYMTSIYLSGAAGSLIGVTLLYAGGWLAITAAGALGGVVVFLLAMTERPLSPSVEREGQPQ